MVSQRGQGTGPPGLGEAIEKMTGWPSPEKVLGELQRLNNNIELIQPDLHKLAQTFDSGGRTDLQNLSAALNKVDLGNVMRVLNDFNHTFKMIYEKLWGKQ